MATVVSIGRNVGELPMDEDRWATFRGKVLAAVRAYTGEIYFYGVGNGLYEGKVEESFTAIGETIDDVWLTSKFVAKMTEVAKEYEQEAIAITIGDTILA